jgi:hypothetical protein
MGLFLTENAAVSLFFGELMNEAADNDTDASEKKKAPTGGDKDSDGADGKDAADTGNDSDGNAEPEQQDDSQSSDSGGAGSKAAPPPPPTAGASAVEIEDTPQNRAFVLEKFLEVVQIHENLVQFVGTLFIKFPSDKKRIDILNQLSHKLEFNLTMLNKALDDQIFVEMDLASLYGLYKIYFNDANSTHRIIKTVVSYQKANQ